MLLFDQSMSQINPFNAHSKKREKSHDSSLIQQCKIAKRKVKKQHRLFRIWISIYKMAFLYVYSVSGVSSPWITLCQNMVWIHFK